MNGLSHAMLTDIFHFMYLLHVIQNKFEMKPPSDIVASRGYTCLNAGYHSQVLTNQQGGSLFYHATSNKQLKPPR